MSKDKGKVTNLQDYKSKSKSKTRKLENEEVNQMNVPDFSDTAASPEFQEELLKLDRLELLNFIWTYDQYIALIVNSDEWEQSHEEEPGSIFPCNIEEYYYEMYQPLERE
jgi:hypothetical protein